MRAAAPGWASHARARRGSTAVSSRARDGRRVDQITRAGADVMIDGRISPADRSDPHGSRCPLAARHAARLPAGVEQIDERDGRDASAGPHAAAASTISMTDRLR